MMDDQVSVEQRHIDASTAGKCGSCPVALAIREHIGMNSDLLIKEFPNDRFEVEVHYYVRIGLRGTNSERRWRVPEVREFEESFDDADSDHVQPFTFELPGLSAWLRECGEGGQ